MAITEADFPALCDDLQEIFSETAENAVAQMKSKDIFEITDTNRRTFDHLILNGLAGIEEVTPGQDLPSVAAVEGDSITYTQRYFGAIAALTKAMRKFDLHDQIEAQVRSITDDSFEKVDQSGADVLGYGWSTTATDVYGATVSTVGPDGLALFSASHSNNANAGVFSNLLKDSAGTADPVLSRDAIVRSRKDALVYRDQNNINRPIDLDTLIIPATLEDLAERIIFSTGVQGTPNVDNNPLKGKIKNIITWSRLDTRSDATDTSAYWYMTNSAKAKESLKMKFAERPSLDAPNQVYVNKNWEWSIDYFYTVGLGYPAYIRGSRGTAATP